MELSRLLLGGAFTAIAAYLFVVATLAVWDALEIAVITPEFAERFHTEHLDGHAMVAALFALLATAALVVLHFSPITFRHYTVIGLCVITITAIAPFHAAQESVPTHDTAPGATALMHVAVGLLILLLSWGTYRSLRSK